MKWKEIFGYSTRNFVSDEGHIITLITPNKRNTYKLGSIRTTISQLKDAEAVGDGEWKQLIEHPGFWVSNHGLAKEKAQNMVSGGYLRVAMSANGKVKQKMVHRLVLEHHVGPCPDGKEACHLDGNKLNNHLWNLAWKTHKENMKDRVKHGT